MTPPPVYHVVRAFLRQARRERAAAEPSYITGLPRLYVGSMKSLPPHLPYRGNACPIRQAVPFKHRPR